MVNCKTCGKKLGWLDGQDEHGRCEDCNTGAIRPKVPPRSSENANTKIGASTTSAPDEPYTVATILAYLSALIIAICSVISCLVLLAGNNGFVGFMVLVSGLGGAIFFMIMAEISHNVASLVRLANAKKEEE